MVDKNLIMERLKNVLDPEIGQSIVDLNMVRDITVEDGNVTVKIALTVAHCPLAKTLQTDVENAVRKPGDVRSEAANRIIIIKKWRKGGSRNRAPWETGHTKHNRDNFREGRSGEILCH